MAFYGAGIFYNSGAFYTGAVTSPAQGIPIDLRFYRTSQDGIYVFWWGFDPAFITPALALAGFDLELDTSPLFDSPNLATFTQLTAITFQNGNVRKGFAVPVAARINATVQTWYARVRTHTVSFTSDWSSTLIWTIPQSVQQSTAEALMESLPDFHVYGKGDLLKPVDQRKTNLWLVEDMYGNQFDQIYYADFLTQTNNYVDLCVDEDLFQNFGVLFNFPKPANMQFVDYRWILMNLYLASLVGSTNEAIILTIQAFTGVPPQITNVRDEDDFFLVTIQDPPVVPSGPQTVFHTSQPYIDSTLRIEDITTGLFVPSSAYTTDGALGTWTMNVATTDTLQAMFDVGNPNDPAPVIFDALSGATALTGLVTFTNGSNNIVGNNAVVSPSLLLSASTFAVLGDTAVTNTGFTVLTGDLGVSPGSSVTGFPPGTFTGSLHQGDAVAAQAHTDATSAAAVLLARTPVTDISSTDLNGATLTAGNYHATSTGTFTATGTLTLDGGGDPNSIFVLSFGTSMTLGANDNVVLINGANANNVYWITGTTFTFGANDTVNGTILAGTSITFASNSVLNGRALCYGPSGTTVTFPSAGTVTVPPPSIISGTLFLSQLSVGQEITDPNGIFIGEISQITDNTHATLLNPWAGPTEVVTAYRLLYTDLQLPPPILWDKSTLAFGVIITIFNPGNFILN